MKTNQKDIYNISSIAEETHNLKSGDKIITNEPIKGTPFRLVGNTIQGYVIAMGKYKLTEPTETEEETLNKIKNIDWNIVANMVVLINTEYEKEKYKDNQKQ